MPYRIGLRKRPEFAALNSMSSVRPKTFTTGTGQEFTIRTAQATDAAALLA